jgi:hypothetical protein
MGLVPLNIMFKIQIPKNILILEPSDLIFLTYLFKTFFQMCLVQIFFRQQNDNPVINFGQQLGVILNFIFRIWDVFGLILIVFGIEVVYEVDQLWLLSLKLDGFSDVE